MRQQPLDLVSSVKYAMSRVIKLEERPENELLLCCARTRSDVDTAHQLRTLAATTIDWEYFFLIARRHAVVALVYKQLQQHAPDIVPSEVLKRFKQHYQENLARNLVLTSELGRVITALADAGIEAVPFKGPTLAEFAYNDLGVRRFVDLDIIVRTQDVFKACDVLVCLNYKPTKPHTPEQQLVLLRTQHCLQFDCQQGRILIELHWKVASHLFASSVSADDLWRELVTIKLKDFEVNSLSADNLLFSLCVHGSKHIWERLAWICDVAELLKRHKIDWPRLIRRAARTDCERMVYLGLSLAETELGAGLPSEVKAMIDCDPLLPSLARGIHQRLFDGPEHAPATSGQHFRFNLNLRKTWRARLRYFVYALQPTEEDLTFRLPRSLSFAYYLMRPVRLVMSNRI